MTRDSHPTPERIVRWLKPSVESVAAAAVYGPDFMLQLEGPAGRGTGAPISRVRRSFPGDRAVPPRHGSGPSVLSRGALW